LKKIALASAAMGGVALIAFGASGTFAAFQDTEQISASAGAGTLDLVLNGAPVAGAANALKLNPGQSTTQAFWIANPGTLAGTVSADAVVLENAENGCTEPEALLDGTCDEGAINGDFTRVATAEVLINGATTEAACATATTGTALFPVRTIDQWVAQPAVVGPMAAGAKACVVVKIMLPQGSDNSVQGDTADFRVDFTLKQNA
jgi:predicted ribosomally synthesized peptide with SipW-like signal peptide